MAYIAVRLGILEIIFTSSMFVRASSKLGSDIGGAGGFACNAFRVGLKLYRGRFSDFWLDIRIFRTVLAPFCNYSNKERQNDILLFQV